MFSNLSILRFVLPDLTCLKVLNLSLPVAILSLDCLSKVDSGIEGSLACSISSLSSYERKNAQNIKEIILLQWGAEERYGDMMAALFIIYLAIWPTIDRSNDQMSSNLSTERHGELF